MSVFSVLRQAGNFFLDTIVPVECIECSREGKWICEKCANTIPVETEDTCFVCKKPRHGGLTCFSCRKICDLTGVMRFLDYDDPLIQAVLRVVKYGYVKDALLPLLEVLTPFLSAKFETIDLDPRSVIFAPVPLHPRKLRERGFNQSEMIAEYVAKIVGGEAKNALCRRHNRPPQVELDEFDRTQNVQKTFFCACPGEVAGRYVFVVDDVATTGATLNECARALRSAKAADVWGLVLAKG